MNVWPSGWSALRRPGCQRRVRNQPSRSVEQLGFRRAPGGPTRTRSTPTTRTAGFRRFDRHRFRSYYPPPARPSCRPSPKGGSLAASQYPDRRSWCARHRSAWSRVVAPKMVPRPVARRIVGDVGRRFGRITAGGEHEHPDCHPTTPIAAPSAISPRTLPPWPTPLTKDPDA